MEEYRIERCAAEPDWENVNALQVGHILWTPDYKIRMEQKTAYCDDALFVYQRAQEPHIRAEHRGPLCSVCEDSCMEFFFMPDGDVRYLNFEWNLNGCLCLGIGCGRSDRIRLVPKAHEQLFDFRSEATELGWQVQYRIPLAFLQEFYPALELKPGLCLRANCYKCGDLTEHPHYLSWNPVTSAAPDYHRPCDFGKMILA